MKRTTVKIPDELDFRLRTEAARREMTVSALVREAIEAHLGGERRFYSIGIGEGDGSGTSERIEEILAEEWSVDRDRDDYREDEERGRTASA